MALPQPQAILYSAVWIEALLRLSHWFWLFLAQACWTGSYIAMKWAGDEMAVGVVVFLRYGFASAGFLAGNLFTGWPRIGKRDFLLVALVGALNFAVAPAMQIASLRYTQAIDVSILIALEPMLVVLVAALVLGEKPTRRTAISLVAGTIGMLILSGVGFGNTSGDLARRLTGNLIFASSLLAEVAVSIAGRRLVSYRASHSIQLMMLAGFLTASICFLEEIQAATFSAFSSRAWGSILFLALGPSIFAYTVWYRVIKVVPVNQVALSLFIQPLLGSILGYTLLDETIGLQTVIGAALVCCSLAWSQIRAANSR